MADGPLFNAYAQLMSRTDAMIADTFVPLTLAVFPTITGIVIVLIAWQGYRVFYGRGGGELLANSLVLLIKYGIIIALFSSFARYNYFIVDIFEDTPDNIATLLSNAYLSPDERENVTSLITLLDAFTKTVTEKAVDHIEGTSIGEKFEGLIILGVTYTFTVFAAFQFAITEVVTVLFLMLAPFALTALMFDKTKGIFEGWLRTLTTMAILKVLLIVMVTMLLTVFEKAPENLNPKDTTYGSASIAVYLLVTGIMILVTFRLPEFASQMGGGLSVSAAGLTVAAVGGAINSAAGAIEGADRAQRGARKGVGAAKEAGMGKGKQALSGAYRGATEALRPDLSSRRYEDDRMDQRALATLGMSRNSDGSTGRIDKAKPPRQVESDERKAERYLNQGAKN